MSTYVFIGGTLIYASIKRAAPNNGIDTTVLPSEDSPVVTRDLSGSGISAFTGSLSAELATSISGQSSASGAGVLTAITDVSVTVALVGQSSSLSAGALAVSSDLLALGSSLSASAEALTGEITYQASGLAASLISGSLGALVAPVISGISASVSPGNFLPSINNDALGQSSSLFSAVLTAEFSRGLSGNAISLSAGLLVAETSTPDVTRPLVGASLTTGNGNFSVTASVSCVGASATLANGQITPSLSTSLSGTAISLTSGSFFKATPCFFPVFSPEYTTGYACADELTVITPSQVTMVGDVWRRFGLDPSYPLIETDSQASFGGVSLAKSGVTAVTSARSGIGASTPQASVMIGDVYRRLGLDELNPLIITDTSIVAGAVNQSIATNGATITVTRQ